MIAPVFFDIPFLPDPVDPFSGGGFASGSPTKFDHRHKSQIRLSPFDRTHFRCFELCYYQAPVDPTASPHINVQSIVKIAIITNRDIIERPTWYRSPLWDVARIAVLQAVSNSMKTLVTRGRTHSEIKTVSHCFIH
jgi:hypothetical protein